jgi:NAD(P)-dependent dehydrogenase (short-subunit alcohol dehydrogenase family)
VIATAQIAPQVTALRDKASALGLSNLRAEKLDLLDPFDVAQALGWEADILVNNAGIGECGPLGEIPIELLRRNFETNLFAPLAFTQGVVRRWISTGRRGKIVFTSSIGSLLTLPGFGAYVASTQALEVVAEALSHELRPYGIKVQTIGPGSCLTGFNEAMADTPFRWLDESRHYTRREALRQQFDSLLGSPAGRLNPDEMIAAMVEIIQADEGLLRNIVPRHVADAVKEHQAEAWEATI